MSLSGQRHASASLRPGVTRFLLHRRLGGPQGRSGRVWKICYPYRDSIPGPSSPQQVATPNTRLRIHLYGEIFAVYFEIHTQHLNWLFGLNVEFLNVKLGGTYSNQ